MNISTFIDFFLPRQCIGCGSFGEYICKSCYKRFILKSTKYCHVCKKSCDNIVHKSCKSKTNLDGVFVCLKYNKFIEKLIAEFKYNLYTDIASVVVGFYISKIKELQLSTEDVLFVPVPLHRRRRWERGFNQAEILTKKICEKFNAHYLNLLIRTRDTKHQVGLKRQERLVNLTNVFAINKKDFDIFQDKFQKKKIFLIDDVMTTGATLEECALALKNNGINEVYAFVLARG